MCLRWKGCTGRCPKAEAGFQVPAFADPSGEFSLRLLLDPGICVLPEAGRGSGPELPSPALAGCTMDCGAASWGGTGPAGAGKALRGDPGA